MSFRSRLLLVAIASLICCAPAFAGGGNDLNFGSGGFQTSEERTRNQVLWLVYVALPAAAGIAFGVCGALRKRWSGGPGTSLLRSLLACVVLGLAWMALPVSLNPEARDVVWVAIFAVLSVAYHLAAGLGGWALGFVPTALVRARRKVAPDQDQ